MITLCYYLILKMNIVRLGGGSETDFTVKFYDLSLSLKIHMVYAHTHMKINVI